MKRSSFWHTLAVMLIVFSMLAISFSIIGCSGREKSEEGAAQTGADTTMHKMTGTMGENTVTIENKQYHPDTLTVATGTDVTWTNKDAEAHTVTSGVPGSPTGLFDSGNIMPDSSYSHTFDSTGTFPYYCTIDPNMRGVIIVQ